MAELIPRMRSLVDREMAGLSVNSGDVVKFRFADINGREVVVRVDVVDRSAVNDQIVYLALLEVISGN